MFSAWVYTVIEGTACALCLLQSILPLCPWVTLRIQIFSFIDDEMLFPVDVTQYVWIPLSLFLSHSLRTIHSQADRVCCNKQQRNKDGKKVLFKVELNSMSSKPAHWVMEEMADNNWKFILCAYFSLLLISLYLFAFRFRYLIGSQRHFPTSKRKTIVEFSIRKQCSLSNVECAMCMPTNFVSFIFQWLYTMYYNIYSIAGFVWLCRFPVSHFESNFVVVKCRVASHSL